MPNKLNHFNEQAKALFLEFLQHNWARQLVTLSSMVPRYLLEYEAPAINDYLRLRADIQ